MKLIKVSVLVAWYDFWIGIFIDTKKKAIYIFPIPCFGFVFYFK
jgi:hypothetical protein